MTVHVPNPPRLLTIGLPRASRDLPGGLTIGLPYQLSGYLAPRHPRLPLLGLNQEHHRDNLDGPRFYVAMVDPSFHILS